jgi:type IV pilus assembly protein PilW
MSLGLIHKRQAGLTLIELMISLALGLIVVCCNHVVFNRTKSYSLQQGSADLQDNANFGLSYVTKDIRLANLNALSAEINDRTKAGGLVLTSKDNGIKIQRLHQIKSIVIYLIVSQEKQQLLQLYL